MKIFQNSEKTYRSSARMRLKPSLAGGCESDAHERGADTAPNGVQQLTHVAAAGGGPLFPHPGKQPERHAGKQDVRHPHRDHRRHPAALGERLAADERDVIDREQEQADADGETDTTAWKAQCDRRTEQHEHEACNRERKLLVNLHGVGVHQHGAVAEANSERVHRRGGERVGRDNRGRDSLRWGLHGVRASLAEGSEPGRRAARGCGRLSAGLLYRQRAQQPAVGGC